jgi:hypothetical protein
MNKKADDGNIFVCMACGKTSLWKYGFDDNGNHVNKDGEQYASRMWDESCVLNCDELNIEDLIFNDHGYVIRIKDGDGNVLS